MTWPYTLRSSSSRDRVGTVITRDHCAHFLMIYKRLNFIFLIIFNLEIC